MGIFPENIFAKEVLIAYHRAIGADMLRLHGFHRFLPHLWELFLWLRRSAAIGQLKAAFWRFPADIAASPERAIESSAIQNAAELGLWGLFFWLISS
jgi:hypothetical protein